MGEEKTAKKGRSVALSGVIGFVLVALLAGMIIGGAVTLLVITPYISQLHQQSNDNQANAGNQNSTNQNGNNNQGPTSATNNPNNNNNQNTYNQGPTNSPNNGNSPLGTDNQNSQNNNQNNTSQGINNNNPTITNPTGQYNSIGSQFSVTTPNNGTQASGTISANVNCIIQQSGNSIQLDLTITPTSVPQSLSQAIQNSPVTFNFGGTISGSQFNAQASGTGGSDPTSPTFNLNLNGSFGSNTLTITVTSASGSQISISTPHSITLQSN